MKLDKKAKQAVKKYVSDLMIDKPAGLVSDALEVADEIVAQYLRALDASTHKTALVSIHEHQQSMEAIVRSCNAARETIKKCTAGLPEHAALFEMFDRYFTLIAVTADAPRNGPYN